MESTRIAIARVTFQNKQRSGSLPHGGIEDDKRNASPDCPGGTDILAKKRIAHAEAVARDERQQHDNADEHHVFPEGEYAVKFGGDFDFRRRNFV